MNTMGVRGRARVRAPAKVALALAMGGTLLAVAAPLSGQTPRDSVAAAQRRPLSFAEALQAAEDASESVQMAQAGVERARGQYFQARSQLLPQITATAGYTRTLATEFSSLQSAPDTTSTPTQPDGCPDFFEPTPGLTPEQRLDSLEFAVQCATTANPFSAFRNLPFGRANQWSLGLSASQTLFAGGRLWAQKSEAESGYETARITLTSARAQLALNVTQAYYDALLSDRMLAIATSSLEQARRTLDHTQLARQVGNKPEFDLLRAQVTVANLEPTVIERRSQRQQAHLRLKQLLDLPLDADLWLTSELGDSLPPLPQAITRLASFAETAEEATYTAADTATELRAPVRQAVRALQAQRSALHAANGERLPSLVVSTNYSRVAYPNGGLPQWDQFRTNWTVGVSLQLPIFTGGRIAGDRMVARANLTEARARLKQTRELAQLDTRSALDALEAAQATWRANARTVDQATRAYQIAELRYQEGISTQLELADSRIMLSQAEANRAVAARELEVARVRMALLPLLPLGTVSGSSSFSAGQGGAGSVPGAATPAQTPTAAQRATQTSAQAIQANRTGGGDR